MKDKKKAKNGSKPVKKVKTPKPKTQKKQVKIASQEWLKELFEFAPDAYYLMDTKGNFIDGNISAQELVGYKKEELIGQNIFTSMLLLSEETPLVAGILAKGAKGESAGPNEFTINHKDGHQIIVEVRTHPVKVEDKIVILGMVHDITKRKEREKLLKIKDDAIASSISAIMMTDLGGQVIYGNDAALEMLGAEDIKDITGKPLATFFKDKDKITEILEELRNIGSWVGEITALRKNGLLLDLQLAISMVMDEENKPASLIASFIDISMYKKTKEMLKESEKRYRLLAENITDTIWVVDMDMKLIFISSSVTRLLGYSVEEAANKTMRETYTPASFELATKALEDELINDKDRDRHRSRIMELELVRKDGSTVFIEGNFTFLRDESGQPSGILTVARDITGWKRLEKDKNISATEWGNIFNSISDLIFIMDTDNTIVKANRAFLELMKSTPGDIIGKKCYELLHKLNAPWPDCPMEKSKRDLKSHTEEVDDPNIGIPLLVTTSPIFNAAGELTGISHIAKDISKTKHGEDEFKKKLHDLEVFHKAAIGRELRIIELKNKVKELENKLKDKPES
jgi:PAS domain S-box-containing protein